MSNVDIRDTATIDFVDAGDVIEANVKLSGTAGNTITLTADGLFAAAGPTGTDDQVAGEVPFDPAGNPLTSTDTQAALEELAALSDTLEPATAAGTDTLTNPIVIGDIVATFEDGNTINFTALAAGSGAGTDDQNAGEVPFANAGTGLAATDTQDAIEELASDAAADVDEQAATTAPTTRSDGSALVTGDEWKDTSGAAPYVTNTWDGSAWVPPAAAPSGGGGYSDESALLTGNTVDLSGMAVGDSITVKAWRNINTSSLSATIASTGTIGGNAIAPVARLHSGEWTFFKHSSTRMSMHGVSHSSLANAPVLHQSQIDGTFDSITFGNAAAVKVVGL